MKLQINRAKTMVFRLKTKEDSKPICTKLDDDQNFLNSRTATYR